MLHCSPVLRESNACNLSRVSREVRYISAFLQVPNLNNAVKIYHYYHEPIEPVNQYCTCQWSLCQKSVHQGGTVYM